MKIFLDLITFIITKFNPTENLILGQQYQCSYSYYLILI